MKITLIFAFLCLVAVAMCIPLENTKPKKTEMFGKCANICEDELYKPLCASDGVKLTLSFANECALKKYNCEHNRIMTKKSDNECPNSQGIRLS